jgi:hypothetical protein
MLLQHAALCVLSFYVCRLLIERTLLPPLSTPRPVRVHRAQSTHQQAPPRHAATC